MYSKSKLVQSILCAALWLFVSGCNPLTFSHEGRIDFDRYTYVYVEPVQEIGNATFGGLNTGSQNYLANQLNNISGFRGAYVDAGRNAQAILAVTLQVDGTRDFETDEVSYEADATWILRTSAGQELARGTTSASDRDIQDAMEAALYDVALYFIRPYRI